MELTTGLLYECGACLLGLVVLGVMLRIANVIGKRENANVNSAAWQAIYDQARDRAEALVCHECGEELHPDLDHCANCGAHIDLDR